MKRKLEATAGNCFLCFTECEDQCEQCDLFSCSSSHLKLHTQSGKCSPWFVEIRPIVGRVVVAARDIHPFEMVMRDVDMLGRVHEDSQACVLCGEALLGSELRRCDCGFYMCESECSNSEHEHYLQECLQLRSLNIGNMESAGKNKVFRSLGFWRMIKLKESEPSNWTSLINLMSHKEKRIKSELFQKSVKDLIESFQLLGVEGIEKEVLSTLQAVLETNSHSFNKSVQYIFAQFSLLSHSCIPNSEHLLSGEQAIVRAKVIIKKGEEITIRYSDLCMHREILKEEIQASWLFSCHCPRCSDETELGTQASSFKCEDCEVGFVGVSGSKVSCTNCEKVTNFKEYVAKAYRLREPELSCSTREDIPKLLEELEKKGCHSLFHSVIQLKIQFIEKTSPSNMDKKTCHLVREYSKDVDSYMEALNPGVSRLRGRLLLSLRKVETWLMERENEKVDMSRIEGMKSRLMEQKMMNGYFKS